MYARIDEEQRCSEWVDFDPRLAFPSDWQWVEVPEALEPLITNEYLLKDGGIQPPSIEYLKDQLKRSLAAIRFEKETGGLILPSGVMALTDRESQGMINNVYQALASGVITDTEFKTNNGWMTVDKENLGDVARAVAEHVRKSFKAERKLSDAIDTMDIPSLVTFYPELAAEYLSAYAE